MISFGPFRLDTGNQRLYRGSEETQLTPKASAILEYLIKRPDELVAHNELLDIVWHGVHVQPEVLKVYIAELRRALGDSADKPSYIKTVYRRGYRVHSEIWTKQMRAFEKQARQSSSAWSGAATNSRYWRKPSTRQRAVNARSFSSPEMQGSVKTALLNAFMQRFGKPARGMRRDRTRCPGKVGNRTVFTHSGCGRKYPRDTEGSSASIGVPGVCAILAGSIPDAH